MEPQPRGMTPATANLTMSSLIFPSHTYTRRLSLKLILHALLTVLLGFSFSELCMYIYPRPLSLKLQLERHAQNLPRFARNLHQGRRHIIPWMMCAGGTKERI